MKILIYGINYAPELTGIGKYTGEMAAFFAEQGDEVEVITAPPYYPQWKIKEGYRGDGYRREVIDDVTVLRSPLYVPQEVTGPRRILHELSFVFSSLRYWLPRFFRHYDLIICVSPPFHLPAPALLHSRLRGTLVVNHIQDLQVDAARDLNIIKQPWLLKILERTERWLLRGVDYVSTISEGMRQKLAAKGLDSAKIIMFPNWVDANLVYPVPQELSARRDWGFSESDKIILYAGNLGEKQGLENILHAADRLRDTPGLHFVIIGEGGAKRRLVEMAGSMRLENVVFKPLQPLNRLAASLAAADIHLVLQKKAAADLVMPSKLTNILAVGGHALVTAESGTTLFDQVHRHQLGTLVEPENVDALEMGLREILAGRRDDDHRGALTFARERLDKQHILTGFRRLLYTLLNNKQHN